MTPEQAADAVEQVWDRFESVASQLDGDAWSRPVPACPGWDVHDLLGHVSGFTTMFAGLPQPDPPEGWSPPDGLNPIDSVTEAAVAARRGWSRQQVLEELRTARHEWTTQLRALPDMDVETMGPLGPTTQEGFFSVRCFDLWSHLFDLHAALEHPFDPAEDCLTARTCYAYTISRVPWLYGKRAGAPDGASVRLALDGPPLEVSKTVTVTGGRATFDDVTNDVAELDTVTGPTAAFALLMTGRLDLRHAQTQGVVARGPEAERLLGVRMFD